MSSSSGGSSEEAGRDDGDEGGDSKKEAADGVHGNDDSSPAEIRLRRDRLLCRHAVSSSNMALPEQACTGKCMRIRVDGTPDFAYRDCRLLS